MRDRSSSMTGPAPMKRTSSAARHAIPLLAALLVAGPAPGVRSQPADLDLGIMHVVVINRSVGRFFRRGTAFHVGGGVFYTNAHVVKDKIPEGYTEWRLTSPSSGLVPDTWLGPATISCIHPLWKDTGDTSLVSPYDVAQLRVDGASELPPALSLANWLPQAGTPVRIKGFPAASRGWPPVLYTSTGRVDEMRMADQTFFIRIDSGFTLGGSSGSPVLADDNRVIGIVFGGSGAEQRTASGEGSAVTVFGIQSGCPAR